MGNGSPVLELDLSTVTLEDLKARALHAYSLLEDVEKPLSCSMRRFSMHFTPILGQLLSISYEFPPVFFESPVVFFIAGTSRAKKPGSARTANWRASRDTSR